MKHHVKFTNELVLTKIVEVLERGVRRLVCHSQCMVFFCLTVLLDFDRYKFHVCEGYFRTESLDASPVIIACNLEKLFTFFVRLLNVNVL